MRAVASSFARPSWLARWPKLKRRQTQGLLSRGNPAGAGAVLPGGIVAERLRELPGQVTMDSRGDSGGTVMQSQAWYFITPTGTRHGPSLTRWHAEVEAARFAARRPDLDRETAATLWQSLAKAGWKVRHTGMKLDRPAHGDGSSD